MQDGVVHERREARGPGGEGRRPMQGVPLALRLRRCFLLQFRQPPPLLLDHLLPCAGGTGDVTVGTPPSQGGRWQCYRQREVASGER